MSEPPIDVAFLSGQTAGDAALEADLLGLFLRQSESVFAVLAAGPDDPGTDLPATLHRLKGSARAIGARPLAAAIEAAEEALRPAGAGATPAAAAALARLSAALTDACCFAASRLPANRRAGLAKTPESR